MKKKPKKVVKQVINRLSRDERLIELKENIVDIGLWNLPSQRELAKKYNVSQPMITKDINKIVSTFDPGELDEVFTEFFNSDKKAMKILRDIIHKPIGGLAIKMEAIGLQLKLQKGVSDLLESFAKKQKAIDRVQVESINYHITIDRPYEGPIKEINDKGIKNKMDSNKETAGSTQDPGR